MFSTSQSRSASTCHSTTLQKLIICVLTISSFLQSSFAQLNFVQYTTSVTAGSTATWLWSGAAGPVTILLRIGEPGSLGIVSTLPRSNTTSLVWSVPTSIVNGQYILEIGDGQVITYSPVFTISGGTSGPILTIASFSGEPSGTFYGSSIDFRTQGLPTGITTGIGSTGASSGLGGIGGSPNTTSVRLTATVLASYTGQSQLTTTCASPTFEAITASGTITLYPLIGCAPQKPECCPFQVQSGIIPAGFGELGECPADYVTIGNACCPRGYSIYSSVLGALTPCVTAFPLPVSAGFITTASGQTLPMVTITDSIFAIKYSLVAQVSSSKLASGAIAGIVIGGLAMVAIIVTALIFLRRRHNRKSQRPVAANDKIELPGQSVEPRELDHTEALSVEHQRYRRGDGHRQYVTPQKPGETTELYGSAPAE